MCGITAAFDTRGGDLQSVVDAMTLTLRHRGPDDAGVLQPGGAPVALGHRRLSIVDLSPLGHNPMPYLNGRYWITFNGEIYNFRALRTELERAGYVFRSQTDTEVIMAAYDRWGVECLQRFVGMFAFALWDASRSELLLARDRLGKKPLYYGEYGGRIAVASELKAIAADPRFPRTVDADAVALYLHYGYIPAPFTIYAHSRKLPPGHYAYVRGEHVDVRRYWDPVPFALRAPTADAASAERQLEDLLRDAVGTRMLADVPVGAFLSGGIDSSLVVALMQEQSTSRVKTFTIRFDDSQFNEADYAAAVARHLKTDHYEQTCGVGEMLDVVAMLPDAYDEPFADSSAIPTYLVSRIARQRVTVALSGDGGDELFFGYPRYRFHMNQRWIISAPAPVRHAAAAIIGALPRRQFRRAAQVLRDSSSDAYDRFVSWWPPDDVRRLTGRETHPSPAYAEVRDRARALDVNLQPPLLDVVTYLPDDILAKVDRASMQVSLETRCPLLDHRVVEFALGLPMSLKCRDGKTKWLLRKLLRRRVPDSLIERPKMGFGVPLASWLLGPLREDVDRLFASDAFERVGVDANVARQEWRNFVDFPDRPDQIWSLFALAAWADRWRLQGAAPLSDVAVLSKQS